MENTENNREAWLTAAIEKFKPLFEEHGYEVPDVRASCGFPSRSSVSSKRRSVGECWDKSVSKAETYEMFISPVQADSCLVLGTLAHEIAHAVVGVKHGHRAPFRKCATAIGLEGKMTATVAGEELRETFKGWVEDLGEYPHAELVPGTAEKKQTTRMIKMECLSCGFIARASRGAMEEHGLPTHCGHEMEVVE